MKKSSLRSLLRIVFSATFWLIIPGILCAQPDPGMNGDSTLVGGGPISGGVPLGSGLIFFMLFGIGYGIRKWWSERGRRQR